MDPAKHREIARLGGKAAHAHGTGHEFTSEEAREAGRKGGLAASQNRERMRELGRLGGAARAKQRREKEDENGSNPIRTNPEE